MLERQIQNIKFSTGLAVIGLAGLFATSSIAAEPSHGAPKAAAQGLNRRFVLNKK